MQLTIERIHLRDDLLQQDIPLKELHCYSLPFGLLGFISHVLTYYTIACLWFGRKPLWPFSKIANSKFDIILGSLGVSLCIIMSIVTMIKCKNTWQLLVIAVWKLSMSLLSGMTALHVAILVINNPDDDIQLKSKTSAWWLVLYIPGMVAGMIGLMSLVVKVTDRSETVLGLTIAFYSVVGASLVVGIISMILTCYLGSGESGKVAATGFLVTIALFIVLSAFYSDWCLGIMLDNLLGTPSSDNSGFYWTYFIAKRLTMFSL
ncbi:hypothetical protein JR316_0013253 [Psilocybe cubensis]|uniref:Uncharacterized protein n=2 Tax=Psilocybe cubensis TaxID=181762 RepID=A0ACB8GGR1_PSICU|nr:hypothetical protein JR316_0013253 [Psilocybe cubensis]KAH9474788.1 hypothetical protein JR316_0013253 [Psilocybe cubensis]